MKPFNVYLDSDVLVSSYLSFTGAASLLLNQDNLVKFYTNIQENELKIVFERLSIEPIQLFQTLKKCTRITLKSLNLDLYSKYTIDQNDRHIIAGAVASDSKYLISYNLKHFRLETIKRDFSINTLSPAQFLQFLRSTKQI
ncbi:MAG: hypothetical protein UW16_C0031G0008 [Microgenomates group bacterium GW2011_GWC1_44_10]|nr:MAG: hypothetical protein UW16_C0031G0008 [Microgenomates group bacterium GW2011_GWC1_44_10]